MSDTWSSQSIGLYVVTVTDAELSKQNDRDGAEPLVLQLREGGDWFRAATLVRLVSAKEPPAS